MACKNAARCSTGTLAMVTLLKQVFAISYVGLSSRGTLVFVCVRSFSRLVVAGEVVFFLCGPCPCCSWRTPNIASQTCRCSLFERRREIFVSVCVRSAKCIRVHKSYAAAAARTSSARTFFGRTAFIAHNSHLISACACAPSGQPDQLSSQNPPICWKTTKEVQKE